ncbi:LytTR family DNA-binding domain-containing protein [Dyadobacter sp. CY261]|uniref:LytR/AlgR family response regulator transcription factor n=1 Tax=Dyadobacter sp. CY261 TaxID=2907203 RepID=UPI001F352138|nr:LytTR family DNA-binding domain-containing protein [Dyadobacter sp. CY261]MCF0071787.1 LytTR family DNA-binding domain-containing protein [Dyadobacter sp. CY261]
MKCVIIDDEPLALSILEKYITAFPLLKLVGKFDDAVEGRRFLKSNPIDLLFIDINMPDLTGLELVARLETRPMIIFTTAYKKFAYEGFELEAVDYLLKPITIERFEKAVQKAAERFEQKKPRQTEESIVVRSEYKAIKIFLSDIAFIEGMEDYIKIHLLGSRHPVTTLMSLKGILEILPENGFSRIHRSYIVPDLQVKSIQSKKVTLLSGFELPVSDSYLDFIDKWKNQQTS